MRSAIRPDANDKDMSALVELPRFRKLLESDRAELKDYLMDHKVELRWNLSEDMQREQMFMLVIDDDIEIVLDLEELLHYTRAV